MIRSLLVCGLLAVPAAAQEGTSILEPELNLDQLDETKIIEINPREKATTADGAVLRGLDKVSGALTDLEMTNGQTLVFGRLEVTLGECRYPVGNPAGDAFAYLVIRDGRDAAPVFQGWMIASSPALNALDHARYDVWLLRCRTS